MRALPSSAGVPDIGRTWGTTAEERALAFPCERHLAGWDDALYRGVDVAAPPGVVFRWLCQLRVAPYSYDWLDNLGRQSPPTLTPGLDDLAVGQPFMRIFDLVEFERDRHVTLRTRRTGWLFGDVVVTYLVVARPDESSRLLVKVLWHYPTRGFVGRIAAQTMPWLDLVMMRKQLLTLKALAERR